MTKYNKKEYYKKYYLKYKIDICRKTIEDYCDKSIDKVYAANREKVQKLYELYPYEDYVDRCFNKMVRRFELRKNNELYRECYDVAIKAYIYTICRCSLKEDSEDLIRAYLYKMMRIYIICIFNIYYGEKKKIREYAFNMKIVQ